MHCFELCMHTSDLVNGPPLTSVPSPSHMGSRAHTPMGGCSSKNRKKDFSPTKEGNGTKDESHSVDPHPQDVCKPQSIAQPPPEPSPDTLQGKRKLLLHSTHYLISVCCSVRVVCCTGGGVELKRCVPWCRVLCSKKVIHRHPSSFTHSWSPNGSPNRRRTITERQFKATWWDVW